jgi:hypothetical protein
MSDPLEHPTYDEAPLAALAGEQLEGKTEEELRVLLQRLREIRQVPQKRKAATTGKKAKIQDDIAHLL